MYKNKSSITMDFNYYSTTTGDLNEMMRQYNENATATYEVKVTYSQPIASK